VAKKPYVDMVDEELMRKLARNRQEYVYVEGAKETAMQTLGDVQANRAQGKSWKGAGETHLRFKSKPYLRKVFTNLKVLDMFKGMDELKKKEKFVEGAVGRIAGLYLSNDSISNPIFLERTLGGHLSGVSGWINHTSKDFTQTFIR
jgi:hypothetical protein